MFFLILFICLAVYGLVTIFPTFWSYGKPIKDSVVVEYAQNNEFGLNPYDDGIVMNKALYRSYDYNFVGGAFYKINFTLFFKYHIDGMGTVWRWSKGAKALDNVRAELMREYAN